MRLGVSGGEQLLSQLQQAWHVLVGQAEEAENAERVSIRITQRIATLAGVWIAARGTGNAFRRRDLEVDAVERRDAARRPAQPLGALDRPLVQGQPDRAGAQLAGRQVETGLLLYPGQDESFFLLMVQPPRRAGSARCSPSGWKCAGRTSG